MTKKRTVPKATPRKRKAVAKIPPSEGDARSGAEVVQLPKRADGSVDEAQVWQAFNNAHHIIEGQQQRINHQQAEIDEANAERKQDRERLFEQSKRIADFADKAVDALAAKPVTILPPAVLPEAIPPATEADWFKQYLTLPYAATVAAFLLASVGGFIAWVVSEHHQTATAAAADIAAARARNAEDREEFKFLRDTAKTQGDRINTQADENSALHGKVSQAEADKATAEAKLQDEQKANKDKQAENDRLSKVLLQAQAQAATAKTAAPPSSTPTASPTQANNTVPPGVVAKP